MPISQHFSALIGKGFLHWSVVIGLIVLGIYGEEKLTGQPVVLATEYRIYRVYRDLNPLPLYPTRTALVLIDDDEYWKGEPARRVPINRKYLARLVRRVVVGNPLVIGLDFDLRSPTVDGKPVDNEPYGLETKELLKAVGEVVARRKVVVLPDTIGLNRAGKAVRLSAVYDGVKLDPAVRHGFIMPAPDIRRIPLSLPAAGGGYLDSFAAAMVRAVDDRSLRYLGGSSAFPYSTFLNTKLFPKILAHDIWKMDDAELEARLAGKIVIVGAAWHRSAYRYGEYIDLHATPAGRVVGANILATYVEALLNWHFLKPLNAWIARIIEFLLALVLAAGIVAFPGRLPGAIAVATIFLLILVVNYISYLSFGRFFDILLPLVLVVVHALVERSREVVRDARAYRRLHPLTYQEVNKPCTQSTSASPP